MQGDRKRGTTEGNTWLQFVKYPMTLVPEGTGVGFGKFGVGVGNLVQRQAEVTDTHRHTVQRWVVRRTSLTRLHYTGEV